MIGQRVSYVGRQGPVSGVVVSVWRYGGVEYVTVRDARGWYHGVRIEEVSDDNND